MRGNFNSNSGNYINGVYTTKNGFNNSGLGCPKGTRLYDTSYNCPIFFRPEDAPIDEHFVPLSNSVAPDVMPYYAISNYGRLLNYKSGKVLKPNYRPNGYEYYCLAAENSKTGQKKYSTNRMVMKTFKPVDNMEDLEANHINGNKAENYVDKRMEDGSLKSNLEWSTPSSNCKHRDETGLGHKGTEFGASFEDATKIRELYNQGYSYNDIMNLYYPSLSVPAIQNICRNRVYKDPNYIPKSQDERRKLNPTKQHRLLPDDIVKIKDLYNHSYNAKDIWKNFYPQFSYSTILDVVNGIGHK